MQLDELGRDVKTVVAEVKVLWNQNQFKFIMIMTCYL